MLRFGKSEAVIIVIHEVLTLEIALTFEAVGVDFLVVAGAELPQAIHWAEHLSHSRLIVPLSALHQEEALHALAPQLQYVQTTWGRELPEWFLEGVRAGSVTWILDGVPADPDDDPAWVAGRLAEHAPILPAWAEIDLDSGYEDAWPLLLRPNEVDLEVCDLNALAGRTPLVFRLPLDLQRCDEMRSELLHAHGWSLSLSKSASAEDLDQLLHVVRYLRGVGSESPST